MLSVQERRTKQPVYALGLEDNALLRKLPPRDRERIVPHLEHIVLHAHDVLYSIDAPIRRAYFPIRGLLSVVAELQDGRAPEVAIVGPEGMVGLSLFFDVDSARLRTVSPMAGECLAMDAEAFSEETRRSPAFRALIGRYNLAYMSHLAQTAACHGAHRIDHRLARLLLICDDAAHAEGFAITQDDLAVMLGVQRPAVSLAAEKLRAADVISYRRGKVRVVDRPRLEAAACECYASVREEYGRLLA